MREARQYFRELSEVFDLLFDADFRTVQQQSFGHITLMPGIVAPPIVVDGIVSGKLVPTLINKKLNLRGYNAVQKHRGC